MKTNFYLSLLAGVAAAAASVSCSVEETLPAHGSNATEMNTVYAKVSISMPKGVGTRAENGTYDPGETYEATISSIALAVYDASGRYVGSGSLYNPTTPGDPSDNHPGETESVSQTFELHLIEGAETPTQVVAFINTDLDASKLTDLVAGVELGAAELFQGQGTGATNFAMTNAGYFDGAGNYVVAAELGEIYTSAEAAIGAQDSNYAEIFVERLAAKIKVEQDEIDQTEPNYKIEDMAGDKVTLEFTPTKWGATGTATSEWLVKTQFKNDAQWMNDAKSYRSYWAESWAYSKDFENYYSNGAVVINPKLLSYISFKDVLGEESSPLITEVKTSGEGKPLYVPEHTTQLSYAADAKNIIANTYALVLGDYEVVSEHHAQWFNNDGTTDFFLLFDRMDGDKKVYTIYNESQLIGLLLSYNGVSIVGTSESEDAITINVLDSQPGIDFTKYLGLEPNDEGKYALVGKSDADGKLYYMKGGSVTEIGANELENMDKSTNSRHYHYEGGHAYFNVPIPHNGAPGAASTVYGVVRNHSYILTINKIVNLGAPLDSNGHKEGDEFTDDPIIPDPDDLTDHFINAEINVLSWHEKSNEVTL